jgi:hypothetical protein
MEASEAGSDGRSWESSDISGSNQSLRSRWQEQSLLSRREQHGEASEVDCLLQGRCKIKAAGRPACLCHLISFFQD